MSREAQKIVVTDWTFPNLDVEEEVISTGGASLVGRRCKNATELISLVSDADAVITQFAKIDASIIGAMTRARAIVRYGIGVDNVDLEAAHNRGVPVCNIPDYCVDEVADHTMAFILAAIRQVVPNTRHLMEGKWGLATPIAAMQSLQNLTVGVIGFGRIGREVVRRLLAFKCRVLVFDAVLPASEIRNAYAEAAASLDDLLAQSDIVTPHCPSSPQTRRMFNTEAFQKMKRGAIFINVGRGDLADSAALVAALQSGKLGGAALDVFDPEPIPTDSPILTMPNVILTAHIASTSPSAVKRLRETAANLALKAVRGEPLPNIVNGIKATR
ncbi:MAG TPA: C-terminal binding protein [Verrucomicrobiae bacterium]|jgi:D-3-phosphoglycerate dehydrogenase|nr:C-terminal binding protein [Verrucomicrobiae bacterium]